MGNETNSYEECPNCNANLVGEKIPLDEREFYGEGVTNYSRLIGIEDPDIYDGTAWWMCPDCQHTWKRFSWVPDWN